MMTKRGRPPTYPIGHLKVGESTVIPWVRDDRGYAINAQQIYSSVSNYGRRHFRQFQTTQRGDGMLVVRIK